MAKSTPILKLHQYEQTDGNQTFNIDTALNDNWAKIDMAVGNKVEKVTGKGLSTNDFTTAEKDRIQNLRDLAMTAEYGKPKYQIYENEPMDVLDGVYYTSAEVSTTQSNYVEVKGIIISGETFEDWTFLGTTDDGVIYSRYQKAGVLSDWKKHLDFTAEEKSKLGGVEENANAYYLPKASNYTLGGVSVTIGGNIDISDGIISVKNASTTQKGVVQLIDNATSASTTLAPTAKALKGVKDAVDLKVDKDGTKVLSDTNFTQLEKTKLANVAQNANNYVLPDATATAKGGVITGENIEVTAGKISVKNASTTQAGIVQLEDNADASTSTTTAPTSNALKRIKDYFVGLIGDLATLRTTDKSSVVGAINELSASPWITPVLLSGFTDVDGSRYRRVGNTTHLQIHVAGTGNGAVAPLFNLPAEFRPSKSIYIPVVAKGGDLRTMRACIYANGDVTISSTAEAMGARDGYIINCVLPL